VLALVGNPLTSLTSLWRRSIQARVVISTLVLSAIVVALVGWILQRQVASGLLAGKETASVSEAAAGIQSAQAQLTAAASTDQSDPDQLLTTLIENLSTRAGQSRLFELVVIGPVGPDVGPSSRGTLTTPGVDKASVPQSLRERVETEPGVWWEYTSFVASDRPAQRDVPGLAVGSQIQLPAAAGTYTLYYVFPLTEQQQTLSLVTRAMITAGTLLVLLLGAIALLVTRQVVTPVRLARRIAERLAAGRLEERMQVRGDDDIARLGTSFNQMATSLQRQIRRLEDLSRVQRRFVSDVSHELRTPLTTVRMAADVLHEARDGFDGSTARSAELLQAELDRFESLLIDLLEISRFDAGAVVLELDDLDLRVIAHHVVDGLNALANKYGIKVVIEEPRHPCTTAADPRRIERIVRNLVSNAIEHSEGGDVVVRVGRDRRSVALSVRDHGVGLRPGEAAMVFNRFWRADQARARTSGGTGLGLAIAAEDANLHGGWLQAWGEPGQGTVFRLTLPVHAGEALLRSPLPLRPDELTASVGSAYARLDTDSPVAPT
jgi:two-component system, OmpR family, sensor histidine kinase MtrB